MAFLNELKQRFSIEGLDDAARKLLGLGQAGEESFKRIKDAADKAPLAETAGKFDKLKGAVQDTTGALRGGISSMTDAGSAMSFLAGRAGPLAAAIAGVAGATLALAKSGIDATIANQRQAQALGLTYTQYLALKKGAREAGVGADELAVALTRADQKIAAEAQSQFKSLIDLSKQLAKSLPGSSIQLIRLEDIQKTREAIARVAPQLQALLAAAGRPVSIPQISFDLEKRLRGTSDLAVAQRQLLRDAGIDPAAVTAAEKLDELVIKNAAEIKSLGINYHDAAGKAKSAFQILGEVFDKFKERFANNPTDPAATALSANIFGRSVGPALIPALVKGSGNLEEIKKQFSDLTEAQKKAALEAKVAFDEIDEAFTRFKNRLGVTVAPVITTAINGILEASGGVKSHYEQLSTDVDAALAAIVDKNKSAAEKIAAVWRVLFGSTGVLGNGIQLPDGAKVAPLPTATGAEGGPGLADGGLVRGPGTGKSDSIFARFARGVGGVRVSNGEFIVTADGSNLGAAIRHFAKGFADGGLVSDVSMPRLGGGGLGAIAPAGGALHPITLQFPWGGSVTGFHASPNAVEQFSREAELAQRASAGRKGSMYGT